MNPQAVKFETGMLLKEKGFDVPTDYGYNSKGGYYQDENFKVNYNGDPYTDLVCSAPTIAEVVMWLYEKHNIWIEASLNQFATPKNLEWMYSITFTQRCTYSYGHKSFNSPTEAYEAAITHTLEKLI